jgi:hypothetical protein
VEIPSRKQKRAKMPKHIAEVLSWVVEGYGHGGYHYNPHVSKPVALEPIGEEGGYHYFGPPADYGGSYGLYTDGSSTIATQRSEEVFSPVSGGPMKYVGPTSFEDVQKALKGSKFASLLHSCDSCGSSYVSSADCVKSMSCIGCGQESEYGNALMRGRNAKR